MEKKTFMFVLFLARENILHVCTSNVICVNMYPTLYYPAKGSVPIIKLSLVYAWQKS